MRRLFFWWPRRGPELELHTPSLALLHARVTSLEHEVQASRLREQELLEENAHLSAQLARQGFRADRLQERLASCRCAELIRQNTKGSA